MAGPLTCFAWFVCRVAEENWNRSNLEKITSRHDDDMTPVKH